MMTTGMSQRWLILRAETHVSLRENTRENRERDDVNDDTKGQTKSSEEMVSREEPATRRGKNSQEPFAHPSSFDFKEEDEEEEEDL